jgi:hypothetical protein
MQVSCSFCNELLEVPAADLGEQISCPHCMLDFELTAASLVDEEEGDSVSAGSWLSSSLSMIVSTGVHTALLVCCALVTCNREVLLPVGDEVTLAELPVQETLTDTPEDALEVDAADVESADDNVAESELEAIPVPESGGGSADLGETIEALTTSGTSVSANTSLDGLSGSRSGASGVAGTGAGDAFEAKLKAAGAKSGDVQISLEWSNGNDLDLWVICPSGEKIFFGHRHSACRGNLDVDMNAGGVDSLTPVENVFWPPRRAPRGRYQVYVHHYSSHGFPDPSRFRVRIKNGGKVKDFTGAVSRGQPATVVHTFQFRGRR